MREWSDLVQQIQTSVGMEKSKRGRYYEHQMGVKLEFACLVVWASSLKRLVFHDTAFH